MSELTYTLLSDGSSDRALMPVLNWLIRSNGVVCAIQPAWADLGWLHRPPTGLTARLIKTIELFPCELLFIHRDAEREPYAVRKDEIRKAAAEAFERIGAPRYICVVPVRMQEAWLLCDEAAIRKAAGNPAGGDNLHLPALERCEDLPDPKRTLHDALSQASGLSARRQAKLRLGFMAHRVAEYTLDFARLRKLGAFRALEQDLQDAIRANAWDER